MISQVNGEPTPANLISYREPGFGDPVDLPLYPYALKYQLDEMRSLIAEEADAFVQDMKLDNEKTGDTYPQYLHDLGYPLLAVLVRHEEAFCETIRRFLASELLRRSFPWSPPYRDVRWIINSIDFVRCSGGDIEVCGQAFRKVE